MRSGVFGVKEGPSNWAGVLEPQLDVRVAWANDLRLVKTAADPKLIPDRSKALAP